MKVLKIIGYGCGSTIIIILFIVFFLLVKMRDELNSEHDYSYSASTLEMFKSKNYLYSYNEDFGFTDICNRDVRVLISEDPNFISKLEIDSNLVFLEDGRIWGVFKDKSEQRKIVKFQDILSLTPVDDIGNFSPIFNKEEVIDLWYKEYIPDSTLLINLNNSTYRFSSNYKDNCTQYSQNIEIYDYTNKLLFSQYYSCDGC